MRQVLILLALFFLSLNVVAQITVEPIPETNASTLAQINLISQEIKEIKSTISSFPSQQQIEDNFSKLDVKITQASNSKSTNDAVLTLMIVLVNDVLLVCGFIIFKTKGWFS